MPFLPAETFDFAHRHSFKAETGQSLFHLFKLEWFNNGLDFFHEIARADTNNEVLRVNRNLLRDEFFFVPASRRIFLENQTFFGSVIVAYLSPV